MARAEAAREAAICRVGVESAGHYHRTLVARLRAAGMEVVELNPSAVKEARSQQLMRRLKSDARDCGAMAELLVRGSRRPPQQRTAALATHSMVRAPTLQCASADRAEQPDPRGARPRLLGPDRRTASDASESTAWSASCAAGVPGSHGRRPRRSSRPRAKS
ncbi:transposase [Streptomyces sp. LN499]|uniref:IS110 family transposase n=1 Tax=Streptomyces sp. LN499 TaxID=3112977 RepID=UPI0037196D92